MVKTIKELLDGNTYPGRGIITGKSKDGNSAVVAYFIMGRSENSRNRIFEIENNSLFTKPFDKSKVKDPSLIIYRATANNKNHYIITNGDQTDTIDTALNQNNTFKDALDTRFYEPDKPNYTPRISSIINFNDNDFKYEMAILKKAKDSDDCIRIYKEYISQNGIGHLIHTYDCDGSPIPSFSTDPKELEIENDIDSFSKRIWNSLDKENKISLFVRYIDLKTKNTTDKIFNKNLGD